jgi:cysteinyl-tRNA synthetase
VLDIHAGGVDLIFPHHEDEIAQSCGYTGQDSFARFWVHGEFLNIAGTKMSKRYGNILTPRDLKEQGVDAGAVRLLMWSTHYRKTLDWTDDALSGAQKASQRLGEFQHRLLDSQGGSDGPALLEASRRLDQEFTAALDDDLNAPRALAAVFAFVQASNAALDAGERPGPEVIKSWKRAEEVLGVVTPVTFISPAGSVNYSVTVSEADDLVLPPEQPPEDPELARLWATRWAKARQQRKSKKKYAEADRIRELLRAAGWEVRDNRDGSIDLVEVHRAG